jgi:3'-5' exoribonuclease
MSLSNIELRHGTRFSTECRIRRPIRRTALNGSKYLSFSIEDCSGSLKAFAWPEHCNISACVHDLDKVHIAGKIREFNGGWLASITSIEHIEADVEKSLQLIPRSMCPLTPLLDRLRNVVAQISNGTLKKFVGGVFSDDDFTLPFINLPASLRHHHASAGGLLEHSLECAEMVSRFGEFGNDKRDLGVVGALFHDVGKIMTLNRQAGSSSGGWLLDHDALTLETLGPHLKRLDHVNRDMATALRYIWTWRLNRRRGVHPVLTVVEAISAADRISTGLSVEEAAFKDIEVWKRHACYGTSNQFWRPRLAIK